MGGLEPPYKLCLQLHAKSFIPARQDSSFVLPASCFARTTNGMKKLINTSVWKYPLKYIDQRYFYYIFTIHMTSICENFIILQMQPWRHSAKEVCLKFSKYSQGTCVLESHCRASGLQFYQKRGCNTDVFLWILQKKFKNTYFEENL